MRARRLYLAGTVSPIQTEVNCYKLLSCGSCDLFVHKAFAGIKEDVFVPAWAIKVAGGKQVPNVRMLVEPHTIFFDIKGKRFLKDKPENFTAETFVSRPSSSRFVREFDGRRELHSFNRPPRLPYRASVFAP